MEIILEYNTPNGEDIIERACRTCYQSWHRYNPPESTKELIQKIIKKKHYCYDNKTQVLTEEGWKFFNDIVTTDKICTLNPQNNNIEYQRPTEVIKDHYAGQMYYIKGKGIDLVVTPDHYLYACLMATKNGRKKNNYQLIKAKDIDDKSFCLQKNGDWKLLSYNNLNENIYELLGYGIGDGSIAHYQIRFHLKKRRKINRLRELANLLGWRWKAYKDNQYSITFPEIYKKLFYDIYKGKEKCIPQYLLIDSNKQQLKKLFDGLIGSDGNIGKTCIRYDTTSELLAGQIQQLALHIGLSATCSAPHIAKITQINGKTIKNRKYCYTLHFIRRNNKPIINKYSKAYGKSTWIPYNGKIYCVTVPNHIIYVRRNGMTVWSGNSVLEHAYANFRLKNVSRVMCNELVRHRHMQFSQESGRYVCYADKPGRQKTKSFSVRIPESVLDYEMRFYHNPDPDYLTEHPEMVVTGFQRYKDLAFACYEYYEQMLAAGVPPEDARYILPNGMLNDIVVSGNLRAWRELLVKRCHPRAHWEIREACNQIKDILIDLYPNVFFDFKKGEMTEEEIKGVH